MKLVVLGYLWLLVGGVLGDEHHLVLCRKLIPSTVPFSC